MDVVEDVGECLGKGPYYSRPIVWLLATIGFLSCISNEACLDYHCVFGSLAKISIISMVWHEKMENIPFVPK